MDSCSLPTDPALAELCLQLRAMSSLCREMTALYRECVHKIALHVRSTVMHQISRRLRQIGQQIPCPEISKRHVLYPTHSPNKRRS